MQSLLLPSTIAILHIEEDESKARGLYAKKSRFCTYQTISPCSPWAIERFSWQHTSVPLFPSLKLLPETLLFALSVITTLPLTWWYTPTSFSSLLISLILKSSMFDCDDILCRHNNRTVVSCLLGIDSFMQKKEYRGTVAQLHHDEEEGFVRFCRQGAQTEQITFRTNPDSGSQRFHESEYWKWWCSVRSTGDKWSLRILIHSSRKRRSYFTRIVLVIQLEVNLSAGVRIETGIVDLVLYNFSSLSSRNVAHTRCKYWAARRNQRECSVDYGPNIAHTKCKYQAERRNQRECSVLCNFRMIEFKTTTYDKILIQNSFEFEELVHKVCTVPFPPPWNLSPSWTDISR